MIATLAFAREEWPWSPKGVLGGAAIISNSATSLVSEVVMEKLFMLDARMVSYVMSSNGLAGVLMGTRGWEG